MVWQPEIDELNQRRELARQMGGEAGIARQRKRGKLTVRERIEAISDPGSFQEIGGLAGSATYEGDKLVAFTPANTVIGTSRLDGRRVILNAGDFTVRGGAADAAGGSVRTFEQLGRTYIPVSSSTPGIERLLCTVPVVSAVLGSVAGLPVVEACLSHFSLMVKDISQVFPGGPPVVKAALGYDINKEDLGDERTQIYEAGVIDNLADSEADAFRMIRRFLSYLPANVWQLPPRGEVPGDPQRREEALLSAIPRQKRRAYDPYAILGYVLDPDSLFEIAPLYGRSRITALARVNGYPVGVMAHNPRFLGSSMDLAAGQKVIRFLQLCDTFHLPMVYFADEPGFMVGLEAQKQGILRGGAKMICTTYRTRMPWISIVIRQLYGVAGQCHDRPGGMFKRVAWPSAHWGSMHIEGGATAAYRREIESASDPEAARRDIETRLQAIASPFRTAEAFNIEDIIDPRDTRPMLCDFIETAQDVLRTQLGASAVPYQP